MTAPLALDGGSTPPPAMFLNPARKEATPKRQYKRKMLEYRLPEERYKQLKALCMSRTAEPLIREALARLDCPGLAPWIYRHVTTRRWKWKRLEANGVPCSGDTFRVYRAKFFYYLDQLETGRKTNEGDVL